MTQEERIELIAYERADAIMVGLGGDSAIRWSIMAPYTPRELFHSQVVKAIRDYLAQTAQCDRNASDRRMTAIRAGWPHAPSNPDKRRRDQT